MQNFIKTIINAVQAWTKKKIIESAADWSQNDPNAVDYVKNRTHWTDKNGTVHKLDSKYLDLPTNLATTEDVQTVANVAEDALDVANDALTSANSKMNAANPVGTGSFSMNRLEGSVVGNYSHAEGNHITASGIASHAEGGPGGTQSNVRISGSSNATQYTVNSTQYLAVGRFIEYNNNIAKITSVDTAGNVIEVDKTLSNEKIALQTVTVYWGASTASGDYSHAEGGGTTASGNYSHAEGYGTTASGDYSHAEGNRTTASRLESHAEGNGTTASGNASHAEGGGGTTASGNYSHAEGYGTTASGDYSHAEGYYTRALRRLQHVQGEYNIPEELGLGRGTYAHIVGNGTSSTARSNAHTLDWDGNAWF